MGPYTVDPMARINTYTKQYFKKPENTEKIKVRLFKIEINIEKMTGQNFGHQWVLLYC